MVAQSVSSARRALDDVEPRYPFLRLGEGSVDDQGLAVSHPDGGGCLRSVERVAGEGAAVRGELLAEGGITGHESSFVWPPRRDLRLLN